MGEGSNSGDSPGELKRPFGRDIADFHVPNSPHPHHLRPAEAVLLTHCREGKLCRFGERRPESPADDNSVRADFLRFLALGGDARHPVHERGVRLQGAYIDGDINLDYAKGVLPISLTLCEVDGRFSAFNAGLAELVLNGSRLSGVILEDAEIDGSVLLRDRCHVEGETRLTGARIKGDLDCTAAQLSNPAGDALAARRVDVLRGVFLCDGFVANGRVRFSGANVGGDFACHGGKFVQQRTVSDPDTAPPRAGDALTLVNARIAGVLWLGPWATHAKGQVELAGSLNLQGAHVATFVDHELSWPPRYIEVDKKRLPCVIQLNGFVYERLGTGAPTDAGARETWLLREVASRHSADFHPQPFEQLMRVLREMGYEQDGRRIGLLKESLMQATRVSRASALSRPVVLLTGYVWGTLAGYGYRSHRLFVFLLLLWLSCTAFFQLAETQGLFAPADAQVWTNQDIVRECERTRWTICDRVSHFITFNAAMYAADVIFPFIDLQQQTHWMPLLKPLAVVLPGVGHVILPPGTVHLVAWLATIVGAACVILLGAILTGLLHRE